MRHGVKALSALALSAVFAAASAQDGQVNVTIYAGFVPTGDGSPFSNPVGSHTAPYISFASDNWMSWHPFGLLRFGAQMTGTLSVEATGNYPFALTSDDGSRLYIDGRLVVDNGFPGVSTHRPPTTLAIVRLSAGLHPFVVNFFEDFGGASGVDLALPRGVVFASGDASDPESLLQQLLADVTGVGPGKSLANKVETALVHYGVADVQATCTVLTGFVNEVRAQQGKKIAVDLADELISEANTIMAVIGCR